MKFQDWGWSYSALFIILQELADDLDKKKQDLRVINKSGQTLIRNLDSQDKVEADLDKLSENYYIVVDNVKEKRDKIKDALGRVTYLLEIIIEIEIWIEEVYVILQRIALPTTDSSVMKSHLEEIQVSRQKFLIRMEILNPWGFPLMTWKYSELNFAYTLLYKKITTLP